MALDHLKDFLIDCEMDAKVAKVARLVSILGEAAFEDKIVSTRLMNKFYEHYFQNFEYAGRPIAANKIYEDINKDDYEKAINALWANVDEAFVEVFGSKRIY